MYAQSLEKSSKKSNNKNRKCIWWCPYIYYFHPLIAIGIDRVMFNSTELWQNAYITKFVGSFKNLENQQWKAKMFCLVSSGNEKHRYLPIDRKILRPCTMEPVFLIFWFWYVGILSLCKQVTIFHKDIYVFSIHSFWEFLLTSYFRMWSIFKSPLKHDNICQKLPVGLSKQNHLGNVFITYL